MDQEEPQEPLVDVKLMVEMVKQERQVVMAEIGDRQVEILKTQEQEDQQEEQSQVVITA